MAKRVQIAMGAIEGVPAYPQILPEDLPNTGLFSQEALQKFIRDILNKGSQDVITGGDLSLTGGLTFALSLPLTIYDELRGKEFNWIPQPGSGPPPMSLALQLQPADPALTRVDIVVATKQADVAAVSETRHVKVDPSTPGSLQGDESITTQIWDQLAVTVIPGTPAANAVAPAVPANSDLLYTATMPAATTILQPGNFADNRFTARTQVAQDALINWLMAQVNLLLANMPPFMARQINIGPGAGVWTGQTVQDFIAAYIGAVLGQDPLTQPELWPRSGGANTNGQAAAVANLDGAQPVIDFDPQQSVVFGDGTQVLFTPQIFPAALNPRTVNTAGSAGTQSENNTVGPLNLGQVSGLVATGTGDWIERNAKLPVAAAFVAAAARNGQFIELFGGQGTGVSALSWWATYDTQADQIIPRTLTGTPPASGPSIDNSGGTPAMFSCGDGVNVLVCAADPGYPRWFMVNTNTWVSTEIMGGPSTWAYGGGTSRFSSFIGDLIAPNQILIIGLNSLGGGAPASYFWLFNVNTQSFTALAVTGAVPSLAGIEYCDACIQQNGSLVLFQVQNGQGQTYVFTLSTLTWVQLGGSQPAGVNGTGLSYFRLRNIGGNPTLIGGHDWETSTASASWVLSGGVWTKFMTSLPNRWNPGAASLLVGGLPIGQGFVFGGMYAAYFSDIFAFSPDGVIQTVWDGQSALTLPPGTTQAVFQLPNYQFQHLTAVATVSLTLQGVLPPGSVIIQESFDGGNTWQTIPPGVATTINSSSGIIRMLRVTLISSGNGVPILSEILEQFEEPGGPGLTGLVTRVNVPAGTNAWYLSKANKSVTLFAVSGSIPAGSGSNPISALLIKTTNNGNGVLPTVVIYRNKRYLQRTYQGAKAAGVNPSFQNDLASDPIYSLAYGISAANGNLYNIAVPATPFDGQITVAGLLATGDGYIVKYWCHTYMPGF
ncbi:MAG TPA: hypothetical protein VI756_15400 [Blastocatellia bacterium]